MESNLLTLLLTKTSASRGLGKEGLGWGLPGVCQLQVLIRNMEVCCLEERHK